MAIREGRASNIACGLVLTIFGSFIVFFIFSFASMVDPELTGQKWWAEVFVHIGSGHGWGAIWFGFFLAFVGLFLVIRECWYILRQLSMRKID